MKVECIGSGKSPAEGPEDRGSVCDRNLAAGMGSLLGGLLARQCDGWRENVFIAKRYGIGYA